MEANLQPHQISLEPNDSQQLATLCGPYDAHLRQIETRLGITIKNRGNDFQLFGDNKVIKTAGELLNHLYREVIGGTRLTSEQVHLFLQESCVDALVRNEADGAEDIVYTRKKMVRASGR